MSHRAIAILVTTALGLSPALSRAEFQLTPAGDPNRIWNASVETSAGYNDNVNTTPASGTNKLSSAEIAIHPQASLKIPGDRTSAQFRYSYDAVYYTERNDPKPDQSHTFDSTVTHSFSPRLTASLGDSLRRGISPELVEQQLSGATLITRRRGDYTYNNLNGSAAFQATGRWGLNFSQAWERWLFDDQHEAAVNDRDGYTSLLSSSYALDARTFVGGSYRFSLTDYSIANTTNEQRNSKSQAIYATVIHRFTPLIVGQINAGAQVAGYSGAMNLSPYLSLSGSYNFGPNSTVSAGWNYNLQLTEVAIYRSSEQSAAFLTFQHRLARNLRLGIDCAYVLSTLHDLNPASRNPNDITQTPTANENSWRVATSLTYDFTTWATIFVNYSYDKVTSSLDNPITGTFRSYDRSQAGAGIRLSY